MQKRMISDVEKLYRFLVGLLRDKIRITEVMRMKKKGWEDREGGTDIHKKVINVRREKERERERGDR